jgi:hypothetical protein
MPRRDEPAGAAAGRPGAQQQQQRGHGDKRTATSGRATTSAAPGNGGLSSIRGAYEALGVQASVRLSLLPRPHHLDGSHAAFSHESAMPVAPALAGRDGPGGCSREPGRSPIRASQGFYAAHGSRYENPHEQQVWPLCRVRHTRLAFPALRLLGLSCLAAPSWPLARHAPTKSAPRARLFKPCHCACPCLTCLPATSGLDDVLSLPCPPVPPLPTKIRAAIALLMEAVPAAAWFGKAPHWPPAVLTPLPPPAATEQQLQQQEGAASAEPGGRGGGAGCSGAAGRTELPAGAPSCADDDGEGEDDDEEGEEDEVGGAGEASAARCIAWPRLRLAAAATAPSPSSPPARMPPRPCRPPRPPVLLLPSVHSSHPFTPPIRSLLPSVHSRRRRPRDQPRGTGAQHGRARGRRAQHTQHTQHRSSASAAHIGPGAWKGREGV